MGDLDYLYAVNPITVALHFEDDKGNRFFGGLIMNEREYEQARARADCPKHENTLDYYHFLMDKAEAAECSPDSYHAPLTKTAPDGSILSVKLYGINADNIVELREATTQDIMTVARHSATYFLTARLWYKHMEAAMKLLPAPSA